METCSVISNFWVCGRNPMVWPFKWNLFSSTFAWYHLFFHILQNEIWDFSSVLVFGTLGFSRTFCSLSLSYSASNRLDTSSSLRLVCWRNKRWTITMRYSLRERTAHGVFMNIHLSKSSMFYRVTKIYHVIWRNDPRSCVCNLSNRKEAWKIFRASTGFEPVTSALLVRCSTNWAMKTNTLGAKSIVSSYVPVKVIEWQMKYMNEPYINCE